jgi:hypothetical protein
VCRGAAIKTCVACLPEHRNTRAPGRVCGLADRNLKTHTHTHTHTHKAQLKSAVSSDVDQLANNASGGFTCDGTTDIL